nr:MAG: E protein [Wufeng rodent arterivirus 1]
MGSVLSTIKDAFIATFHEMLISLVDIILFLLVLFGIAFIGWFVAFIIRIVAHTCLSRRRPATTPMALAKIA